MPESNEQYRACGYGQNADGTAARVTSGWGGFGAAHDAFRAMLGSGYERGVALQSRGAGLQGPVVIKWADGTPA